MPTPFRQEDEDPEESKTWEAEKKSPQRPWIPGDPEPSYERFHLRCSIEGEDCEPGGRWMTYYDPRRRPKCDGHGVKMKRCEGCPLCRPDQL